MATPGEETGFYRAMLAVETDATRYYGADANRPAVLSVSDAEQMVAHIAADLKALLPEISNCSLIAAGALYDQTQILRPTFPVFEALEKTVTSKRAERFNPRLVSVGAPDGKMPVEALQPLTDIPLGLLQLLPISIHGPADLVAELGQAMEYRFLEEGQVSAHTAAWLESAFNVSINHARLMTLTDLNAMLRMQLDHFGFLQLWELLDAALNGHEETLKLKTETGQNYEWHKGAIYTNFETFDFWASQGGGAAILDTQQSLARAYADWTRELRQYLTTLQGHGLDVYFRDAASGEVLEGTFFAELSSDHGETGDSTMTEHSYEELGTVAITARHDERLMNFYPLVPQGLNDIHAHLRDQIPGGHTVAFPGTILYDSKTRGLVSDHHEMADLH